MASATKFPLQVFYDGGCTVCSREMGVYQRHENMKQLHFVDISASDFDAVAQGGTQQAFMRELHVRDAEGRFFTGIAAFSRIWSAFPASTRYHLLEFGVNLPVIRQGAELGYTIFARMRHLLPKRGGHDKHCRRH